MDRIDNKWKSIFPELVEEQEIVRFIKQYISKEQLKDERKVIHGRYDTDEESFIRVEKVIGKDCPFHKFISLVLLQFYKNLKYQIKKYQDIVEVEQVIDDVLRYMGQKVLTIAARTLIQEIHRCEEMHKLEGTTEEERYDYYNEQLSIRREYIYELEEKYPVLFCMIDKMMHKQIGYTKEILENVSLHSADVAALVGTRSIGKVQALQLGLGDSHCGGKTVVEIKFNKGEVIYKPRNLYMEENWSNLVEFVNDKYGKKILKAVKTISGIDYGFMEKVCYSECEYVNDVEEFFFHSGCLLAILYSLNASDCHFENIISVGTYPVLVDMELLLGINPNERKDDKGSVGKAIKALYYSATQVGLLPFQVSVGKKKIDIGGVCNVNNQKAPVKSLVIKEKGSAKIHFEYEEHTLKSKKNIPMLAESMEEKRCVECMVVGFEKLYDFILKHKEEYMQKVFSLFEKTDIRVLYNPTMVYSNLLGISYHPMFMEAELDRLKLLSRIALIDRDNEILVRSEMNMMMENDIPYYSVKFKGRVIVDGNDLIINDNLNFSPCDNFLRKMSWFSQNDKMLQKEILRDSYYRFDYHDNLTNFKWSCQVNFEQNGIQKNNMLSTAEKILDYLYQIRSFSSVNERGITERCFVGSTILNMDKDNWRKDLIDFDLYDGHIGLVYLYFYAAKHLKNDKYRKIAQEILHMIQCNYELLVRKQLLSTGLYKGLGGYIITLAEYYNDIGDEGFELLIALMKLGFDEMEKNNLIDLIDGNVGFVLATLYVGERVKNKMIKQLVDSIVKKARDMILYVSKKIDVNFSGYAHGMSAFLVVLYRIHQYLKDIEILKFMEKLIQYDREIFLDKDKHDWYRAKNEKEFSKGWCHGSPGVLLGRIQLKKMGYRDDFLEKEIEWLTEHVKKESFGYNLSYCHGDLGNLSILKKVAIINSDEELKRLVDGNFYELYKLTIRDWNQFKKPVEKLNGLMVGLGGIAFALINFAKDEKEPAFISLI